MVFPDFFAAKPTFWPSQESGSRSDHLPSVGWSSKEPTEFGTDTATNQFGNNKSYVFGETWITDLVPSGYD